MDRNNKQNSLKKTISDIGITSIKLPLGKIYRKTLCKWSLILNFRQDERN